MEVDMSDEVADDTMIVFCCGGVCPNWACCCCCCCCCWGCGWFLLYADNWDIGNDSWDGVMNNDCWPIGGGCCDRPYPKFDWLNYKWHQVDKLIITYMHIAFQYLWFFKSFSLFAHLYFTDMYKTYPCFLLQNLRGSNRETHKGMLRGKHGLKRWTWVLCWHT